MPYANFSNAVPFCGNITKGWTVIDNSSLPDTWYLCKRALNGTYAWFPYCPCSSALLNGTIYFYQTSILMGMNATLYGDVSTQWINLGVTYLATLAVQDLIVNGTLDFCPSNTSQPMRVNLLISCNNDAVHIGAGLIIDNGGIVVSNGGVVADGDVITPGIVFGGTGVQGGSYTDATSTGPAPFPFGVWLTGGTSTNFATLVMASASSTTFNAGSFLDIASGATVRRQPVAVTTTGLTVTCNGKLCLITLVTGVCDSSWSTGGVCTLTVNNAAITIATTAARVDFTQVSNGVIPGTQPPPVLGLVNLLSGSVQVILYCYGLTGCTAATQVLLLEIMN
jgi:hypothetical protein